MVDTSILYIIYRHNFILALFQHRNGRTSILHYTVCFTCTHNSSVVFARSLMSDHYILLWTTPIKARRHLLKSQKNFNPQTHRHNYVSLFCTTSQLTEPLKTFSYNCSLTYLSILLYRAPPALSCLVLGWLLTGNRSLYWCL